MTALTDTLAKLTPRQAHWFAERVLGLDLADLHAWCPGFCPCGGVDDAPPIPAQREHTA